MSQRLRVATRLITRSVEDLIMAVAANELLGVLFDVLDEPMTTDTDIECVIDFFKEFGILILECSLTALTAYELKDFFYDQDAPDYTNGLIYNFVFMYQPRLLWRMRRVGNYLTMLIESSVSKIGKSQ